MKPLSDPLNSLTIVGRLLMWSPSFPVSSKKLSGAAAILIAAWGHGGFAPILIFREALEIFAYRCFAYLPLAKYVLSF